MPTTLTELSAIAAAAVDDRWNSLFDFIHQTPAAGLDGAAVKLRMLTDRAIGICNNLDDARAEAKALRDIRRVVRRELKAQHCPTGRGWASGSFPPTREQGGLQ